MSQILEATFDGAVLRPETVLDLEPNTRVRITVESLPTPEQPRRSFLKTALSLNLDGPADWSENLDEHLDGESRPTG